MNKLSPSPFDGVSIGQPEATDGVLPLFPELPPADRYPIERLGPGLASAAEAIVRKVQVPEAMAAQSVLATASLAVQAHVDVWLPFGQSRPTSLFCVTFALSGDRKTTSDREAQQGVARREGALRSEHALEFRAWKITQSAWAAEKRKIETDRDLDLDSRSLALKKLGAEPPRPLQPFLTSGDLTIEGLIKNWGDAHPALGIFTAEGAQFTSGHAMNADNKRKTAAILSQLWDGETVKRLRAGDGITLLPGRRLAAHLLIQPEGAAEFLSDDILRDQGLLSRVLVAEAPTRAGTRFWREVNLLDDAAIEAFSSQSLSILARPPVTSDGRNELTPCVITMSSEAREIWVNFYNTVETHCSGRLKSIVDFANKAAEHVARIAGVMAAVRDITASEIDAATMLDAAVLVDWYISEKLRFAEKGKADPVLRNSAVLLDWIKANGGEVKKSDMLQYGPNPLRTKAALEECIDILLTHNQIHESSKRPRCFRLGSSQL